MRLLNLDFVFNYVLVSNTRLLQFRWWEYFVFLGEKVFQIIVIFNNTIVFIIYRVVKIIY